MPKKILKSAFQAQKDQDALKQKYDLETDAIIIEKKNFIAQILRVVLRAAGTVLRIVASAIVVVLAVMGVCVFIYPVLRTEFVTIAHDWYMQISMYFT